MKNVKLIACDIDGVLLEDTFSPILYKLAKKFDIPYTVDLEKNMFSQNRKKAEYYFKEKIFQSGKTTQNNIDVLKLFFDSRKKYIENSSSPILDGVPAFIERLKSMNVEIICYGGLKESMIDTNFLPYLKKFNAYICTNEFRPGLKEIVQDYYHLDYSEVLFIDDVASVASEAKNHSVRFIGVPTQHKWGFQREEMKTINTKYIVQSVKEITTNYLSIVDLDQNFWEGR